MNKKQIENYLDMLTDVIFDLNNISVENDDIFSSEIIEMEELIKRMRRNING
jgi:hypothetical protein